MKILGSKAGRKRSACCRNMAVGLLRRGFAAGQSIFEVPFAQRAAGRHRIDNVAEGFALRVAARSHLLTNLSAKLFRTNLVSLDRQRSTKLCSGPAAFPLLPIDFS